MLVSVCIPTYNAAGYLREAIESALAQTRAPDEIIVIDDGSTDAAGQVCASFGPIVRYIYQENDHTFGAGARARAMREARGEWLALLDHDDRWLPTKLEKQLQAAESNPDVCAVFTRLRVIDAMGEHVDEPEESSGEVIRMSPRDAFHLLLRQNPCCPSSALVRRSFIVEHGVTDPLSMGCADWDLWLSIARRYPIILIDERLTEYRTYPEQFTSDKRRLTEGLERTLKAQRERLHPGCASCRESFRAGRAHIKHVYGVAARALLDQYHTAAKAGELPRALTFLWSALRASPGEVLRPRRLAAVLKNAVLSPFKKQVGVARKPQRD